jgi:hypothetical protein
MRGMVRVVWGSTAAAMTCGVILIAAHVQSEQAAAASVSITGATQYRIPKCDTDGFYRWVTTPSDSAERRVPVSHEDLTNSQAHDCQRLIEEVGEHLRYGPLVALLVSTRRVSQPDAAFSDGLVVAEIVNHDASSYAPLGIQGGVVSCLWIRRESRPPLPEPFPTALPPPLAYIWTAQIRRPTSGNCLDGELGPPSEPLIVVRRTYGPLYNPGTDYPNTGRWMWDPVNRTQFIGIRCGNAWCEIGRRNPQFVPSPAFTAETVPGWSDEQLLAYMPVGAEEVVVSTLYGRIEPAPELRNTHPSRYFSLLGEHVATITFSGGTDSVRAVYAHKYALACTCTNEIRLYMRGERTRRPRDPSVLDTTYAFSSNRTRWQTIIRNTHTNHAGTGAVRWAWNDNDEGSWVECPPNTCCRTDCTTPGSCP